MKICVITETQWSRNGNIRSRTSDGYYYGESIIYRNIVYLESDKLTKLEAYIILKFINESFSKQSDNRCDGPETPEISLMYSDYSTNQLVHLLNNDRFKASETYDDFVQALPIVKSLVAENRKIISGYIQAKNEIIKTYISMLISVEIEYFKRITESSNYLNHSIEVKPPSKVKIIEILKAWRDEIVSICNEDNFKIGASSNLLSGGFRELYIGSLDFSIIIKGIDDILKNQNSN